MVSPYRAVDPAAVVDRDIIKDEPTSDELFQDLKRHWRELAEVNKDLAQLERDMNQKMTRRDELMELCKTVGTQMMDLVKKGR